MTRKEDEIYFDKINEIAEKVYDFYNMSNREDLIMVYEMKENKIYSYIYKEYLSSLNPRSKEMLEEQYKEAKTSGRIVLFIKDELRRKMKSFTI